MKFIVRFQRVTNRTIHVTVQQNVGDSRKYILKVLQNLQRNVTLYINIVKTGTNILLYFLLSKTRKVKMSSINNLSLK